MIPVKDNNIIRETTTEYGGFIKSLEGDYKLMFTTEMSELLCRERAVEEAARINLGELGMGRPVKFDPEDVLVLKRTKETVLNKWESLERQEEKEDAPVQEPEEEKRSVPEDADVWKEKSTALYKTLNDISLSESLVFSHKVSLYFDISKEFGHLLVPSLCSGEDDILLYTKLRIDVPCRLDKNCQPVQFYTDQIAAAVSLVTWDNTQKENGHADWTDIHLPEDFIWQCVFHAADERDEPAHKVLSAMEEQKYGPSCAPAEKQDMEEGSEKESDIER